MPVKENCQRNCTATFVSPVLHIGHVIYVAGFEVKVDHPHTHVVKATKLVNGKYKLHFL